MVLNGPNLNLLGQREPGVYGGDTLATIEALCHDRARAHGLAVDFHQSNHEGELVELVHAAGARCRGIVVNAGAYTHTSVALLDALRAVRLPVVEVHLSNVFQRESFRHHSYIAPVALGVISGFGKDGYAFAIDALAARTREERNT
ncbi:type II 3-dehydroquinate dehydratase [Limimonas halophila]